MRWLFGFFLILVVFPAWAHQTIRYDGTSSIPVHVKKNSRVHINFPAGITRANGPVDPSSINLVIDEPAHPHRLIVEALMPPAEVLVHVNTITGHQYLLQIKTVQAKPHDVMDIVDVPKPVVAESEGNNQPAPGEKPVAIADPVRQLWHAQWAGDPRLVPRGVTMQPLRETLLATAGQKIEIIWGYTARGFYGFTERVTNTSNAPLVLWLPGLHDPYARLWSANIDRHSPPLSPGQQPHVVNPGQSVLLHLVYQEVAH